MCPFEISCECLRRSSCGVAIQSHKNPAVFIAARCLTPQTVCESQCDRRLQSIDFAIPHFVANTKDVKMKYAQAITPIDFYFPNSLLHHHMSDAIVRECERSDCNHK